MFSDCGMRSRPGANFRMGGADLKFGQRRDLRSAHGSAFLEVARAGGHAESADSAEVLKVLSRP